MQFTNNKKQIESTQELISLKEDLTPLTRELSPKEIKAFYKKNFELERQKFKFNLAFLTLLSYFGVFLLLSFMIVISNLKNVNSTDAKWVTSQFLQMSSPLVTAVVFYYYGKTKS